jgi:hypothetical protein
MTRRVLVINQLGVLGGLAYRLGCKNGAEDET